MAITGTSEKNKGRIRFGMVGGGQGAFIGAVHRIAAAAAVDGPPGPADEPKPVIVMSG